eukprot:TRINITY_DN7437_c0_g1_i9.p2 TRINITY_DN7437_c0_g1~~TRINITY_DN7437_c0_g1_i9.p2  ORF type:complete len:258 (-),score=70.10 TRINITY_DN7437_c0_g1_i9:58-831(-)
MMVASAQVLWAYLFHRHLLDPGYAKFLDAQVGQPPAIVEALRTVLLTETYDTRAVAAVVQKAGHAFPNPLCSDAVCQISHPFSPSCTVGAVRFAVAGLGRTLPVYIPVFVVSMLLFNTKQLRTAPVPLLAKTSAGILRSSVFLSLYVTFAWASMCLQRQIGQGHGELPAALSGFVGGSAILLEKPGRRLELALYVGTQALIGSWHALVAQGRVSDVPHSASILFALGFGALLQSYTELPAAMRASYFSILKAALGEV